MPTQVANGDELKAAIVAGGSIQLTADINFDTATCLHVKKSVTLDLNGKTITAVANGGCTDGGRVTHFIRVMSEGNLTIEDTSESKKGAITVSYGGNSSLRVIEVLSGGKLTVTGGTIQNAGGDATNFGSSTVYVCKGGVFDLKGGVIHGENATAKAFPVWVDGGNMTMSGGKISATCDYADGITLVGGQLTVTDGDITELIGASISPSKNYTISLQGGSFKGALSPEWIDVGNYGICNGVNTQVVTDKPMEYTAAVNDVLYYISENGADLAVQNAVNGQKLVLLKTPSADVKTTKVFAQGQSLTVTVEDGAVFDSSMITPAKQCLVQASSTDGSTTIYTVCVDPQQAEAKIGDVYYTTLLGAFASDEAKNGGTIVLLKDVDWGKYGKITNSPCTLDLNGHTISCAARYTTTNIKYAKSVFKFNGTGTLTITDSSATKTGAIINTSNQSSGYGYALWADNGTISVLDGAFKGFSDDIVTTNSGSVIVSGGYFSTNPSAYLAADKAAVASGRADYPWMVTDATGSIVEPAVGEPDVTIPESVAKYEEVLKAAAEDIEVQGLEAYASTVAQQSNVTKETATKALNDAQIQATGDNTYIYAQAYLQITPKSYTKPVVDGGETVVPELTMEITPMYRLVASTADDPAKIAVKGDDNVDETTANAVVIPNTESEKLDVKGTVHMVVPMPDGFVSSEGTIFVQHKNYEYAAEVTEHLQGKFVAEFDNPHGFSTFTFTMAPVSEATLNGIGYAKFADAIADTKNGETVFVLKDGLTAEMSGDSRTITVKNGTEEKITFKVNGKDYTLEKKDDKVQITYTRPTTGGGSVSTYTLTFEVNGGSELKKLTRAYGTTIDLSDYIPTRAGYTFAGWYSDKELTEKVTSIKLNSNTTVYAKWTLNAGGTVAGFTDVKIEDWFAEEVQYVVDKGLMSGTSSTTFAPNGTTTRGMIVAILYRMEKEPTAPASAFTDVKAGAYYEKAIDWAAANEIVKGVSETTFAPDQAITREQLAAILYRYAQFKGYNVSKMNKLDSYADAAQVSPYAVSAMQWANAENLITGKSATILDPKGNATRAEVSSILMRFCENIAK